MLEIKFRILSEPIHCRAGAIIPAGPDRVHIRDHKCHPVVQCPPRRVALYCEVNVRNEDYNIDLFSHGALPSLRLLLLLLSVYVSVETLLQVGVETLHQVGVEGERAEEEEEERHEEDPHADHQVQRHHPHRTHAHAGTAEEKLHKGRRI